MEFIFNIIKNFGQAILQALPQSPFNSIINNITNLPYLGYLNWFIPIPQIIAVLEIWLTAVALFYVYKAIVKWAGLL